MLNVTERAKAKLKELLESESDDRSVGLQLGKTPSGALTSFQTGNEPTTRWSSTTGRRSPEHGEREGDNPEEGWEAGRRARTGPARGQTR
jgi:hypothetical protein